MDIPTPAFAPSILAKFNLRQALPVEDPLTVPLLRLMLATDDVRHLQNLLVTARDIDEASTESDRLVHEGEVGHLFRLLGGHLYEAIAPFRAVDQTDDGRLDRAVANDPAGKEALAALRDAYDPERSGKKNDSFLYQVRNSIAFHYGDQEVRASFEKHDQRADSEGVLVLTEEMGLGRFSITDELTKLVIADTMKVSPAEFEVNYMRWIGEALTMAAQLATVVSDLVADLLAAHAAEMRRDKVTIPPALRAARDKVEEDRRRAREPQGRTR